MKGPNFWTLGMIAIPGLYAVVYCAKGIINYNYCLAHALADNTACFALNTGRIASEHAI